MAEKKGPLTIEIHGCAGNESAAGASPRHRCGDGEPQAGCAVSPDRRCPWLVDLVNATAPGANSEARRPSPRSRAIRHITVPAGYFRGLPVGRIVLRPRLDEPTLIKLAYAYEQPRSTENRRRSRRARASER